MLERTTSPSHSEHWAEVTFLRTVKCPKTQRCVSIEQLDFPSRQQLHTGHNRLCRSGREWKLPETFPHPSLTIAPSHPKETRTRRGVVLANASAHLSPTKYLSLPSPRSRYRRRAVEVLGCPRERRHKANGPRTSFSLREGSSEVSQIEREWRKGARKPRSPFLPVAA